MHTVYRVCAPPTLADIEMIPFHDIAKNSSQWTVVEKEKVTLARPATNEEGKLALL